MIDSCFVAGNEARLFGTSDLVLNTDILYVINHITSKFRFSILIKMYITSTEMSCLNVVIVYIVNVLSISFVANIVICSSGNFP